MKLDFFAAIFAWDSAICAVGGNGLFVIGSTNKAQSPIANTPGNFGTSRKLLIINFPFSVLNIDLLIVLTGVTPAVQIKVFVIIDSTSDWSIESFGVSSNVFIVTSFPSKLVTAFLIEYQFPFLLISFLQSLLIFIKSR